MKSIYLLCFIILSVFFRIETFENRDIISSDTIYNSYYRMAQKALATHNWTFVASSVEAEGIDFQLSDSYNYLSCKGDSVSVQFGLLSIPQSAGVMGFNAQGNASQVSFKIDKQGNLLYSFLFTGEGIIAKVVLRVLARSNTCYLGFYPQQSGNYLTFNGELLSFQSY